MISRTFSRDRIVELPILLSYCKPDNEKILLFVVIKYSTFSNVFVVILVKSG